MAANDQPRLRILVYGGGLSADLVSAALVAGVGETCDILRVTPAYRPADDILFGGAAPPSAYELFRSIGLGEPELMLEGSAAFSYGTRFVDWTDKGGGWFQSFQQPLEPVFGVPFHQHVSARNEPLEPYLIAARAALAGKFAHPPADGRHPLSRAEYGYHFDAPVVSRLLSSIPAVQKIDKYCAMATRVAVEHGRITEISLDNGQSVTADLFVDCSGGARSIISALRPAFEAGMQLTAAAVGLPSARTGPPHRTISPISNGWSAETPLQGKTVSLNVFAASQTVAPKDAAAEAIDFETGSLEDAWLGNCVALGHAASVFEPLTPAPMILLERSARRLVELTPVTKEMEVERREFNRRFRNDVAHASMFHCALFGATNKQGAEYWDAKRRVDAPDGLRRKIRQFESGGHLVQFDHEPFTTEDWAVLHFGLGRRPARASALAQRASVRDVENAMSGIRDAQARVVEAMPTHHDYLIKFRDYLAKRQRDPS
jgi:tryptophan halogenase